jgi:hypothetical protein
MRDSYRSVVEGGPGIGTNASTRPLSPARF